MAWFPTLIDEVSVTVTGQPQHSKKQLYFLALAVAFRLVKRFMRVTRIVGGDPNTFIMRYVDPPPGMLNITYDAAGNWVTAQLHYENNMGSVFSPSVRDFGPDIVGDVYDNMTVYTGPKCDVVGHPFEFTGGGTFDPAGSGIPTTSISKGAPTLPFADRTILTQCPLVPNPVPGYPYPPSTEIVPSPNTRPPFDHRSRGASIEAGTMNDANPTDCCPTVQGLIPLVMAALTDPGGFNKEVWPVPKPGPLGG